MDWPDRGKKQTYRGTDFYITRSGRFDWSCRSVGGSRVMNLYAHSEKRLIKKVQKHIDRNFKREMWAKRV